MTKKLITKKSKYLPFNRSRNRDKKTYFNAVELINLFQELYFLYDRGNIIKRTFINKINKFLPIYCSERF